jgi:hypothetical protein
MLRLGDETLFGIFLLEADALAADIRSRELHLAACRQAVQEWPGEVTALADRVDLERSRALAAADRLAQAVTREAAELANSLRETADGVQRVLARYGGPGAARPVALNRTA